MSSDERDFHKYWIMCIFGLSVIGDVFPDWNKDYKFKILVYFKYQFVQQNVQTRFKSIPNFLIDHNWWNIYNYLKKKIYI